MPVQISPGGQGFRSDLPDSTWYNNGLTGEDYVGLMSIPEIAFGTVHFCKALTTPAVLPVLRFPAPVCMVILEIADPLQFELPTCACNASLGRQRLHCRKLWQHGPPQPQAKHFGT